MTVLRWRPMGQGLEPWVGAREVGDTQSEVNRLFDSFFGRSVQVGSSERSSERWTGRVERIFQLPIPVQADHVRASYREGVLTVTLPKVEAVKPKEIKIDVL